MGSLTFSEMATIAVILLIVFGPRRLPEIARRAGAITSRLRDAARDLREEFGEEYADTVAPLEEVRRDLRAARDDVTEVARAMSDDIEGGTSGDDPGGLATPETVRDRLRAARREDRSPQDVTQSRRDETDEAPES